MAEVIDRSVPCPIRNLAMTDPDRPALYDDYGPTSYRKFDRVIDATIARLKARGLESGNVIGVLGHNSIAYVTLLFAAWRSGFVLMPLNCRLSPEDWSRQAAEAGCKLLILDDEHRQYADRFEAAAASLDKIATDPGVASKPNSEYKCLLDREALIIFSSGTTAVPRGVVLTWANLFYSARGAASLLAYRPDDIWLAALPFFHIGGISIPFRAALAGCAAYIMDRFDAARAVDIVRQRGISYISVVATMLADMIRADEKNALARCRGIILGGSAWDEPLVREIESRHLTVLTTYGLTETSSMVTLSPLDSPPDKLAKSGKSLPFREIIILDEDGRESESGKAGRIAVRGETVFSRYLGQRSPPRTRDGWFVTDDIGRIDRDGYLTVIGRADSVIISGGENIDLNHIEREFRRLPGVVGAAVLSRPDRRWGNRPVAFVEVRKKGIDESTLMADIGKRLPKLMIPDRIIVLERLPRTGSGKHDRSALRRYYSDIFGDDVQS